ncbi:MAG: hypothetical protein U1E11_10935 [Dethiobacteria bacterium]|nr:hypothetical protein [Dethiobacteria bacterium]
MVNLIKFKLPKGCTFQNFNEAFEVVQPQQDLKDTGGRFFVLQRQLRAPETAQEGLSKSKDGIRLYPREVSKMNYFLVENKEVKDGLYPVFCSSGPERCDPALFLGWQDLNQPVRCPRCGRYTEARIPGPRFQRSCK